MCAIAFHYLKISDVYKITTCTTQVQHPSLRLGDVTLASLPLFGEVNESKSTTRNHRLRRCVDRSPY
eukprot:COSAG01_NODE_46932_length_395_cov_1.037162_1_plen_66_part_10